MRVTPNSVRGRQLTAAKGTTDVGTLRQGLSPDQEQWNAEVEQRKQLRATQGPRQAKPEVRPHG